MTIFDYLLEDASSYKHTILYVKLQTIEINELSRRI